MSSSAVLLVPTPLQGVPDALEAGGHTHITAVVRLYIALWGVFASGSFQRRPLQSHLYPCHQEHPPIIMSHTRVCSPLLLASPASFASWAEQVLKQPTNTQAGLCQQHLGRADLWYSAQSRCQLSTSHVKDRIHTGDLLGSLLQILSWGRFTAAAGGVVMQVIW